MIESGPGSGSESQSWRKEKQDKEVNEKFGRFVRMLRKAKNDFDEEETSSSLKLSKESNCVKSTPGTLKVKETTFFHGEESKKCELGGKKH